MLFDTYIDLKTGTVTQRPFTKTETDEYNRREAEKISAEAQLPKPAPRDPLKELDDLKAALMAKGVLKPEDLKGPA